MKLSEKDIDSFIELYDKSFKVKLSRCEALEQANALINLVKLTFKPMTRQEHRKYYGSLKK